MASLRITFHCQLRWEDLPRGDAADTARDCPTCARSIPNLSAMSGAEQLAWVNQPDRPPCARALHDPEGWVMARDGARVLRLGAPLPRLALTAGLALSGAVTATLPSFVAPPEVPPAQSAAPAAPAQATAPPPPAVNPETLQLLQTMGYYIED